MHIVIPTATSKKTTRKSGKKKKEEFKWYPRIIFNTKEGSKIRMAGINPITSIITLNGNRLNMSLKRQDIKIMDKLPRPTDITSTKDTFQIQRYKQVGSKRMENLFHINSNNKKAQVAIINSK